MIKIVFISLGCLMLFSVKYLSECNELVFKYENKIELLKAGKINQLTNFPDWQTNINHDFVLNLLAT